MLFQLLTQKVIGGLLVVFALGLTISNVSEQFGGSNGASQDNYAQINGSGSGLGSGEEQCFDWSGAAATTSTLKSASKSKLSAQSGSDSACDALVAEVVSLIPPVPLAQISCKCVNTPSSDACATGCPQSLYPTSTAYSHWTENPVHHPNPAPTPVPCSSPSTLQVCDKTVPVAVDCCVGRIAFGKCCGKKLHFGRDYCGEHASYCVPPASPSASPTPSGSGADSTGSGSGPGSGPQGSGPSGSGSGPDSTGSGHSLNRGELNNYYASLARINRFVD